MKSVVWLPGSHDVYCFTEPEEHKGVFGNSLTYQCQDIGQMFSRWLAPFFGVDLEVEVRCRRIDDHEITFQKCEVMMQAKAITKNEVRKMMEMMVTSEPWGNDIAGDPSPNEQLLQTQMMALPDQAAEQEGGVILPGDDSPAGADANPEPDEIVRSRPKTGSLGKGSKGPQDKQKPGKKSLDVRPELLGAMRSLGMIRKHYSHKLQTNGKH